MEPRSPHRARADPIPAARGVRRRLHAGGRRVGVPARTRRARRLAGQEPARAPRRCARTTVLAARVHRRLRRRAAGRRRRGARAAGPPRRLLPGPREPDGRGPARRRARGGPGRGAGGGYRQPARRRRVRAGGRRHPAGPGDHRRAADVLGLPRPVHRSPRLAGPSARPGRRAGPHPPAAAVGAGHHRLLPGRPHGGRGGLGRGGVTGYAAGRRDGALRAVASTGYRCRQERGAGGSRGSAPGGVRGGGGRGQRGRDVVVPAAPGLRGEPDGQAR